MISLFQFKRTWFIALLTLAYLLSLTTSPGHYRIRAPLDPIISLYAGAGVIFLFDLIQRKFKRSVDPVHAAHAAR